MDNNREEKQGMTAEALFERFGIVDEAIRRTIRSLVTESGFVSVDCDDVVQILENGAIKFGTGTAFGSDRAEEAARLAAQSLLDNGGMLSGSGIAVLVRFATPKDATLLELSSATDVIESYMAPDARMIWGQTISDEMDGFQVDLIVSKKR